MDPRTGATWRWPGKGPAPLGRHLVTLTRSWISRRLARGPEHRLPGAFGNRAQGRRQWIGGAHLVHERLENAGASSAPTTPTATPKSASRSPPPTTIRMYVLR